MRDDFNPSEFESYDELDELDQIALDLEFNEDGIQIDPDELSKYDSLIDD